MNILPNFYLIFYISNAILSMEIPIEKLNVIIFFAETDKMPTCDEGMRFLQMQELARVKHGDESNYLRKYVFRRNYQTCKELLDQSVQSLVHFSENALGMKTAVVKSECHHFSLNAASNNQFEQPYQYIRASDQNKLKKSMYQSENVPTITRLNKNTKNKIVLSPEHTEVFKIRVRRNPMMGEENEPVKVSCEKIKKPDWDVLDIMSHVRFSFFGNLFNNEKNKLAKEENDVLTNLKDTSPDISSLFETVSSTLASLQESPCNGFLMVVYGGLLHEINNVYSPLIQSLKHVTEVTDPKNTLIVVTSACPEIKQAGRDLVEIKEGARMFRNLTVLPVYARGPKSERLAQCTVLYDIPLIVKNILEEMSPAFKKTYK